MINSYILTLQNNIVTVSEYADGTLIPLKNRGEEEQTYHELTFWSWLKQKIEYQEEELSFIVITDDENFVIPEEAKIKLHQTNAFNNNSYINDKVITLSHNLFVFLFPQRVIPEPTKKEEPQEEKQKEEPMDENALAGYFRQQTQEFKNEKN